MVKFSFVSRPFLFLKTPELFYTCTQPADRALIAEGGPGRAGPGNRLKIDTCVLMGEQSNFFLQPGNEAFLRSAQYAQFGARNCGHFAAKKTTCTSIKNSEFSFL